MMLGDLHNGHVNIFSGENFKWFYKSYYLSYSQYNALEDLDLYEVFTNPDVM